MPQTEVSPVAQAIHQVDFSFSDTVAGYVQSFDKETGIVVLKTPGGHDFPVKIRGNTYAMMARNLESPYQDCTGHIHEMLTPGRYVFAYSIFYPQGGKHAAEAQYLMFLGRQVGEYVFERQDWWVKQIESIANFYHKAQFGDGHPDFREYRTQISLTGERAKDNFRQETDTISRLVYGFASAYMLTGEDKFLAAAEAGTEYLREHMRFYDKDENLIYWYHGIDVHGTKETKVFASEFGDDFDAIPAYEQIYAMAGPVQTYRITGDARILRDAEMTLDLFERFYEDKEKGGYFSHLDPITLNPRSDSLGPNKGKKNWNSVGDHAPAYLINLYLATGDERCAKMLEYTFDLITKHFPDYDHSPFVQEKFFEDWSADRTHMWQQNRGVIGHNLKIAWNLMRMHSLKPKPEYEALARKIASMMPTVGMDPQRGGWYDVMERAKAEGEEVHRFAFHDRKAWWQQEQGILAYLILNGVLGDAEYRKRSQESSSFYNAFFLDHDDGAVYFNVLASGVPYLCGTERLKGSHSMSGYHSTELCYLAQTYTNLLITKQPLTLYFKPRPHNLKDRILRVSPDILPPGRLTLEKVWIDDQPYNDFDKQALTVKLPDQGEQVRVKVQLEPK